MPITKMSSKNQIVIPKEVRRKMNLKPGDQFIIDSFNGTMVILPKPKSFAKALHGISKGLYSKNYIQRERNSW